MEKKRTELDKRYEKCRKTKKVIDMNENPITRTIPKAVEYIRSIDHGTPVNKSNLRAAVRNGYIPTRIVGKRIFVDVDDVLEFFKVHSDSRSNTNPISETKHLIHGPEENQVSVCARACAHSLDGDECENKEEGQLDDCNRGDLFCNGEEKDSAHARTHTAKKAVH